VNEEDPERDRARRRRWYTRVCVRVWVDLFRRATFLRGGGGGGGGGGGTFIEEDLFRGRGRRRREKGPWRTCDITSRV